MLQLWTKLASLHATPKGMLLPVLKAVTFHISDKGCYVAKNAISFFRVVLENNPYAGRVSIKALISWYNVTVIFLGRLQFNL